MGPDCRSVSFVVAAALCVLCACQSSVTRSAPEPVSVEAWNPSDGMTRKQLDAEIRRFAQSFAAKLNQFFEDVRESDLTPDERRHVVLAQTRANNSVINIAIGDNAVTNLLDMLVLATLSRMVAEKDDTADSYGAARAAALVDMTRVLEADIWGLSDQVLTGQQQAELKSLIVDWRADNPGLDNIYHIRFGSFPGVDAGDLAEVQRDGGLLSQFARTADAAEELSELGERTLFFSKFAPHLISLQVQATVYDVMRQPEVQESLKNANNVAQTIERLPESRLEFVDQLLKGIAVERAALFANIVDEQASISQLLTDLKPVLESAVLLTANVNETMQAAERTAVAVNLDLGGDSTGTGGESTGVDIGAYQQLVIESATTVVELRLLIESLHTLADSQLINDGIPPAFQSVRDEIDYFLHRFFILLLTAIVVFFGTLYLYRHARYHYHRPRS
jgi:hypothetical protein